MDNSVEFPLTPKKSHCKKRKKNLILDKMFPTRRI